MGFVSGAPLDLRASAGNKKAGALLFSTEKRGTANGEPSRLFFTSVAVKEVGASASVATK